MVNADAGRHLVAERGLTAAAVSALTPLMGNVGFEELGLVKSLLKRFFSDGPWTALDAAALARAVGPPAPGAEGDEDVRVIRHPLDAELTLVAGWVDGGFLLDVDLDTEARDAKPAARSAGLVDLGRTFASGVVPEPTPNPRTIRFATARRPVAASESHRRGGPVGDAGVAAIFAVDDDVADVLVASDFVAVSVARPGRWPDLLEPVLDVVAEHFGGDAEAVDEDPRPEALDVDVRGATAPPRPPATGAGAERRRSRLDRAWVDLGHLDASDAADLDAVLAAARDTDGARRQVAAQLLGDAPPEVAAATWSALVTDASRLVRRAVVDAVAGAAREDLRPLLERALADADAWTRWKALHGLAVLGAEPSRAAIAPLDDDPDFRVRLEAANARRPRS